MNSKNYYSDFPFSMQSYKREGNLALLDGTFLTNSQMKIWLYVGDN